MGNKHIPRWIGFCAIITLLAAFYLILIEKNTEWGIFLASILGLAACVGNAVFAKKNANANYRFFLTMSVGLSLLIVVYIFTMLL